jgi:hypothetical protein
MEKRKAENSSVPAWLDALVGPLYLDFVSPFPLEEAIRLLKQEEVSGWFRYRRIRVDLIPQDADTFGYTLTKSGNRYATTEARGYLKRWGKQSTLVTGQVNVTTAYYILYVAITVFMLVFISTMFIRMTWFVLLFVGIMLVNWYVIRRNRHDVARLIEKALHAEDTDTGGSPISWER